MLIGAACHAQSSGLGASAHALDRVGEFERELKAGLAWFDAQAVRTSGLVEDRALGAEEALGRLRAPSPPTPSDTPLRAIMITPLQLFPLTHQTASPNSVASAGDSTVIIEEPLASATHADLDTRQFSAPLVQPLRYLIPQDLHTCSRVLDLESAAKLHCTECQPPFTFVNRITLPSINTTFPPLVSEVTDFVGAGESKEALAGVEGGGIAKNTLEMK